MKHYGFSIELDEIDPNVFGLKKRSFLDFIENCFTRYEKEKINGNNDDNNHPIDNGNDRRNYNKMIEMEESSHRDLENNDNYTRNQESVAAYEFMSSL